MAELVTIENGIILYLCIALPVAAIIVIRRSGRERRILRHGEPATARVVALRDTGASFNNASVAELELEVPGPGEARRVVTRFTVPPLFASRFQPGCEVAIRVDPTAPDRVLVDRAAMGI